MHVLTFGCRLNHIESALLAQQNFPYEHPVVVNTCAVTAEAERQARQAVRRLHKTQPKAHLIITGCSAQLHPTTWAQMPGVVKVLGNVEKLTLPLKYTADKIQVSPLSGTLPIPTPLYTPGTPRAYIQIQQGCDYACSFCATRLVRGKNIGLPLAQIMRQAHFLQAQGVREITLTGVNIMAYPGGIVPVIVALLAEKMFARIRLGSVDPACLTDDFIMLFENPVLMPHLHLSMQSASDQILRRMGRRHCVQQTAQSLAQLRALRPEMTFGADLITGFPTETAEDFEQTCHFVEENGLTHLHVFPYSLRPGTPAEKWPEIPVCLRKKRAETLRLLGQHTAHQAQNKLIGQKVKVLAETATSGYTDTYWKVHWQTPVAVGTMVSIQITGKGDENALVGTL